MASSLTLYDDAGNPVVVSGEDLKGLGGVGVGQTWVDVKLLRETNTDYTNSTTRPIMVNIAGGSADSEYKIFINDIEVAWSARQSGDSNTMSVIVPVGSIYRLEAVVGTTVGVWSELR